MTSQHSDYPRDMVGYGPNVPKVTWPNGARIAISVVVNYEEGSEATVLDGDAFHETSGDIASSRPPAERNRQIETQWEYGSRAGVWRMMRMLKKFEIDTTWYLCALALERNPALGEAIASTNDDVCGHGYRWIHQWQLGRREEEKWIADTAESITRLTGKTPTGWYTRGGPSPNTREILAEQGFQYDCEELNDDLPYYTMAGGKPWLVLPYAFDTNDGTYWTGRWLSGEDFTSYLKASFDHLYREGAEYPRMLNIALHSRISGRPGRAEAVERFLDYARSKPDVWFARRVDIANWWKKEFPPMGH